jgi:hypothetical protein
MKTLASSILLALLLCCQPLPAEDSKPRAAGAAPSSDTWTKTLADRSERGKLHAAFQNVRGDSGKWRDEPALQHAPPIEQKPPKLALDDWADKLLEKEPVTDDRSDMRPIAVTAADDNWLIFRTRQLDDNDRLWIERVERKGNQFTVVLSEAIWQGRYFKTFTYYGVFGVNLGKLEPGKYEVKWIVQPLAFKQFDGDGRPTRQIEGGRALENWPKDESPAEKKPVELRTTFTVQESLRDGNR